jgi:8-oxo-dGTP diphosphatase
MARHEPPSDKERRRRLDAKPSKGYDSSRFERFAVTCDIVILTMRDHRPHVLLVKRAAAPFAGYWALPGGFKQPNESLDQAAARELEEETTFPAPTYLRQFRSYGDPGRDLRTNVVTVAYLAVVPEIGGLSAGTDAVAAEVFPIDMIRSGELDIAFDHEQIIQDAVGHVADELETSDIATSFLPKEFTLFQLRNVYESFWGSKFDGANFRRNLVEVTNPYVVELLTKDERGRVKNKTAPSPPGGGRPGFLFAATDSWKKFGPPIRRRPGKNPRS